MCSQKHEIALSVFFPCYNEEQNLQGLLFETISVLEGLVQQYEILIINDGSTDKTGLVAEGLSKHHENVRVIHHYKNRGYGAALITGFTNSVHDWIFFTDGDHQFFISEIEALLSEISRNDMVIGFRKDRQDPWHRIFYAWAWNRLVQLLFGLKVRDVDCAFKLINKRFLDDLSLQSSGAAINTELMIKVKHSGARVKEVPVSHRPRMFGTQTGGNPKVVIRAFWELLKIYKELKVSD